MAAGRGRATPTPPPLDLSLAVDIVAIPATSGAMTRTGCWPLTNVMDWIPVTMIDDRADPGFVTNLHELAWFTPVYVKLDSLLIGRPDVEDQAALVAVPCGRFESAANTTIVVQPRALRFKKELLLRTLENATPTPTPEEIHAAARELLAIHEEFA